MREGQGNHRDVPWGVQVAGLEGHVSRSAVYLIHKGLGRRRAEEGYSAGVLCYEIGCYHTRSVNVLYLVVLPELVTIFR